MYYVYVIQNDLGKIYIGQTINLQLRLYRHNGVLPTSKRSYTRQRIGTWKVVYKEEVVTRDEALNRERYLKSHKGRDFVRLKIEGL